MLRAIELKWGWADWLEVGIGMGIGWGGGPHAQGGSS